MVYATNGCMAIRIERDLDISDYSDATIIPSQIDDMLDVERNTDNPVKEIPQERIEIKPCDACAGTGKIAVCDKCEGEGVVDCECCGHQEECTDCCGMGRTLGVTKGQDCEICLGKKTVDVGLHVMLGEAKVNGGFLDAIVTELEDVKFYCYDKLIAVYFTFKGGEGILMPLRQ